MKVVPHFAHNQLFKYQKIYNIFMSEKIVLNVTIEIPKNSNIKYEYDRETGKISVDRILYGPSVYPQNYGFLPEALD
jgi:inorganic pyrophosphatase